MALRSLKKNPIGLLVVGLTLAACAAVGCKKRPPAAEQDTVLSGRHLSEHQVADIAFQALSNNAPFECRFKDGVWEIAEVQKDVSGISSIVTNADGRIFVTMTNASRVVLRVRDADGKVEPVKIP